MTLAIRGGTVVDGTGSPPVRADVLVEGERVHAALRHLWCVLKEIELPHV